ncbi:MAG: hypothetical protein ACYTAF_00070 [Planctomycetota bacterium]|jgi:hypothetical protein
MLITVLASLLLAACSAPPAPQPEEAPPAPAEQQEETEPPPPPPPPQEPIEKPAPPPAKKPKEKPPKQEKKKKQELPYSIRALVQATKDEEGAPLMRVFGTADLPDDAVFLLYLHYGKLRAGKHLQSRKTRVKDGGFTCAFDIYTGIVLPGKHIVQIAFRRVVQPRSVLQKLGDSFSECAFTVELKIGTEQEIKDAYRTVGKRLAKDLQRFDAMAEEVLETFTKRLKDRDLDAWDKQVKEWEEEHHQILERNVNYPEYRAIGIESIGSTRIGRLGELLHWMFEYGNKAMRADPDKTDLLRDMKATRNNTHALVRRCMEKLGARKSTAKDLRTETGKLVEKLEGIPAMLKGYAEKGEKGVDELREAFPKFENELKKDMFELHRISPLYFQEHVSSLNDDVVEIVRILWELKEDGDLSNDRIEGPLRVVRKTRDRFFRALDNWKDFAEEE